ncbi:GerAB/ArcD/ProY family transporter [Desertibacillus haloalkaliphilus]|uniref:GerAB/ArcD/ProY family transporter n=1 Tax=Desertibacillus haloalkaliphilus TaxID=1328930 RepID=UPI001C25A04D|nr:GerAB/ArcD/ProY family transporter [Desertibacillus haloalkaliphilus]MBU8905272.1 spore germination protein [Desertibacillus haloalkaliphilus]
MKEEHYKLVPFEVSILLIAMITSIGILTLPKTLATEMNNPDGWISILISGMIMMFLLHLYVKLQRNFPGENLLQFLKKSTFGFFIAKTIAVMFIVNFIGVVAFDVRLLAIVLKMYLLDQTPSEIIIAVMLLTSTYAVSKGLQGITHLSLLFVPIVIGIMVVMLISNIPNGDFDELLPIMGDGVLQIDEGIRHGIIHFAGIKILFFLMAYMDKKHLKSFPLNTGLGLTVLLKAFAVVVSFAVFSVNMNKTIIFPTIELGKEIEIVGGFIERLESLLLVIWIMTIFLTLALAQYLSIKLIHEEFLRQKKGFYLLGTVVFIIFLVSFIPDSISEIEYLIIVLESYSFLLIIFSLLCGYVILWIRRKKKKIVTENSL